MTDKPPPNDDAFLTRWSRLKKEQSAEPVKAVEAEAPAPPIDAPPPPDLPDPETLTADSDFSAFLKEGVPEAVQRKALRMLWRSDPVLANLDGLNDYDDDFSLSHVAVEAVKTAWRVGRGYTAENDLDTSTESATVTGADISEISADQPVEEVENNLETTEKFAGSKNSTMESNS
ncbi:MAG: DUF3306 domain-containing protein [Magnetospiraceae bacterium]